MRDTPIEWADDTVNVVEGCSEVDTDCRGCYAKGIAARFSGEDKKGAPGHYAGLARLSEVRRLPQWTGVVRLFPERLDEMFWRLLRAPEPRKQFLCSMGDIFHREAPDAFLDEVFARIAILESRRDGEPRMFQKTLEPHPIYMLTKRPERAAEYTNAPDVEERVKAAAKRLIGRARAPMGTGRKAGIAQLFCFRMPSWPLRSVALITSAGTQAGADARVPALLRTKAAIRGVSCEPMTGPVDFERWLDARQVCGGPLDWIILGGESGRGARPCAIAWMDAVAEQAERAGVPLFVKQLGAVLARELGRAGKGGELDDLPERLRVRQHPVIRPA